MKTQVTLIFLALFSLQSCTNNKKEQIVGEMSVVLNGEIFTGNLIVSNKDSFLNFGISNSEDDIPHNSFSLSFVKKIKSKQQLKNRDPNSVGIPIFPYSSYSTMTDDGDVVCEVYIINENDSSKNFLQIDKLSSSEIRGSFQVTMYKIQSCPTEDSPDSLKCTNGRFTILLE